MADVISVVDIEEVLVEDLSALASRLGVGIAFSGTPVSPSLGEGQSLPYVALTRVGGSRRSLVVDEFQLTADTYAETWADATEAAGMVAGLVTSLPHVDVPTQIVDVSIDTLPYELPDSGEPGIPRMRALFSVIVRGDVAAI